jgi:glycerol-3-phosphate dehydrogenase
MQEARREAFIEEQRQIKEQGFLTVMWPKLLTFLVMLLLWIAFLQWYF